MCTPPRFSLLPSRRGFTLLELAIVLALVGILTAIGIIMSNDMLPRYRTRAAALQFQAKAQQCRAAAIRSGRECIIRFLSTDSSLTDLTTNTGVYWIGLGNRNRGSTTWDYLPVNTGTADIDASQGQVDIGDDTGPHFWRRVGLAPLTTNPQAAGYCTGTENCIVFGPRGFVTNADGGAGGGGGSWNSAGYIPVTFVNKVARAEGRVEDYTARVTRSGMVRVDPTQNDTLNTLSSGTLSSSTTP